MESTSSSNRKYFIGGNFKSNGTVEFIEKHCQFLNEINFDNNQVDVAICPTYIHLERAKTLLKDSKIIISSQNVSMFNDGAYTGEISAKQLIDLGINWTLIGHSERRQYFNENEEVLGKKIKLSLENGLNVIACIGETWEQREANQTFEVLGAQLVTIKHSVSDWSKLVIAYEPVWAIGTGKTASPEQAQEVHGWLRNWIKENVGNDQAEGVRIIYGGSVTDANSAELIKQADIDGFLVGGASLKPAFKTIILSTLNN